MPIYEVQGPDGQVYEVEGPSPPTADQLAQMFGPAREAPSAPEFPTGGTATGISAGRRGVVDRALDVIPNRERLSEGIPGILAGVAQQGGNIVRQGGDLLRAGWNMVAPDSLDVDRPYQREGDVPPTTPYQQLGQRGVQAAELAGGVKAMTKAPGVMAKGLGVSKVRAGQNIRGALEAAKDVPVSMADVSPAVARGVQLGQRGGQRSLMIHQLNNAIKKAQTGTLSVDEAQDFVSNASRMSATGTRLTGPMQRQVTEVATALRDAITEAADVVGRGGQYTRGVREYARANKAARAGKRIAQLGGFGGGTLVIGDHILRRITDAISAGGSR